MTCPTCNAPASVTDSRFNRGYTRRKRQCEGCGRRFSTVELVMDEERGGIVVPFFRWSKAGLTVVETDEEDE